MSAIATSRPVPAAPLAVVTGGAKRIGRVVCEALHATGHDVLIHCHRSQADADALAARLNDKRPASARVVTADLGSPDAATQIFTSARDWHDHGVTVLVNNASTYYPTPISTLTPAQWADLRQSNLDAPLWLAQAFARQPDAHGCIINLTDTMVPRGIPRYAPYAAAKAGLINLTQSLAQELAPQIRVNAVAPGSILWPEPPPDEQSTRAHLETIPLHRLGTPEDIAAAVTFLVSAPYITGQILAVDGGRGL
ncbi:MAG: SDR family oxidoreductase [Oceanococcaceae bacterium]